MNWTRRHPEFRFPFTFYYLMKKKQLRVIRFALNQEEDKLKLPEPTTEDWKRDFTSENRRFLLWNSHTRPLKVTFLWSLTNHREQSSGKSASISLKHTITCSQFWNKHTLQLLLSLAPSLFTIILSILLHSPAAAVSSAEYWHIWNTFWWREMVWSFFFVL